MPCAKLCKFPFHHPFDLRGCYPDLCRVLCKGCAFVAARTAPGCEDGQTEFAQLPAPKARDGLLTVMVWHELIFLSDLVLR